MSLGRYIFRDILILIVVIGILIGSSIGIYQLINKSRRRSPPQRALALELKLKDLIRSSIVAAEETLEIPELQQAIDVITERLTEAYGTFPYTLEILVVDSPIVNALAFPGGLIVCYSGLLEKLDSAEELAAILAHELGHVVYRDAMKQLTRRIGMDVLLSLAGGHQAEVLLKRIVREVVDLRYSRTVEQRADRYALDLLLQAHIDPAFLGKALEQLQKDSGEHKSPEVFKYLDTHPELGTRTEEAAVFETGGQIFESLNLDWPAIKDKLPGLLD